jgi:hypothetical protein
MIGPEALAVVLQDLHGFGRERGVPSLLDSGELHIHAVAQELREVFDNIMAIGSRENAAQPSSLETPSPSSMQREGCGFDSPLDL